MSSRSRDALARVAVTVGAVLPYLPLLGFGRIYVTDDLFTSDIYNGELPARVLLARTLASGRPPTWTSELCSGFPLAAGGGFEPISLASFGALAPAAALSVLALALVWIAAHGAFGFARRLGADRGGAVLAGIAYAGSGYFVTQLKHLSILGTVAWLPWGLLLLDRALTSASDVPTTRRLRDLALFGLVYAEQSAAGFPQSLYISSLVYAAWALTLLVLLLRSGTSRRRVLALLAALGAAAALGAMTAAPMLLPLREIQAVSDRTGPPSFAYASMLPYRWRDALTFFVPYANGDAATGTYRGESLFWEVYGYVGIATVLLAFWAVLRGLRRPRVLLLAVIAVVAFLVVLGPTTPFFGLLFRVLPGMDRFRFPTRFLVVVDLALALLAGLGLGVLRADLERWLRTLAPAVSAWLPEVIVLGTALDLFANQSHQNPFVPASEWLAPPPSVAALSAPGSRDEVRVLTPLHDVVHRVMFEVAHGWTDLDPYRGLRDAIAPNLGVFWNVPTADCYAGLTPEWSVHVWGDQHRIGHVVNELVEATPDHLEADPSFRRVLEAFGVTHVLSPLPVRGGGLGPMPRAGSTYMYRVGGRRVRVVPRAELAPSDHAAVDRLLEPSFDPATSVLLSGPGVLAPPLSGAAPFTGDAHIAEDRGNLVRIDVAAPGGGFLVLADTSFPGWTAEVDGAPAWLWRANVSLRAVALPPGAQHVVLRFAGTAFWSGLWLALGAVAVLLLAFVGLGWAARRASPTDVRDGAGSE